MHSTQQVKPAITAVALEKAAEKLRENNTEVDGLSR